MNKTIHYKLAPGAKPPNVAMPRHQCQGHQWHLSAHRCLCDNDKLSVTLSSGVYLFAHDDTCQINLYRCSDSEELDVLAAKLRVRVKAYLDNDNQPCVLFENTLDANKQRFMDELMPMLIKKVSDKTWLAKMHVVYRPRIELRDMASADLPPGFVGAANGIN